MHDKTINDQLFAVSDDLKDFILYQVSDSTQVDFVGFNVTSSKAFVQFARGAKYVYHGVSEKEMTSFGDYKTKGQFVGEVLIKGHHDYDRRDDLQIIKL